MSPLRRATPPPRPLRLSYATHLPRLSAETLKRLARMWVGREASRLNKQACIQAICQGLTDPAAVRRGRGGPPELQRPRPGALKPYGPPPPPAGPGPAIIQRCFALPRPRAAPSPLSAARGGH